MELEKLTEQWEYEKYQENQCKARRLELESAILDIVDIKDGSNKFDNGLVITRNLKKEYDVESLENKECFDVVYKPNTKKIKELMEHNPEEYKKILEVLTITQQKPNFKVA